MSTSKYLKNVSDLLLSDKKIDMMELYYNLNMKKAKLKKENGLPCKMFLFMSDDDDYNVYCMQLIVGQDDLLTAIPPTRLIETRIITEPIRLSFRPSFMFFSIAPPHLN